ncbi:hypothetical protein DL240_14345 [Lujinxingia litoralis]|uniref:YiaAB two helix domain-containing protein n=1 Tax=Lujinxingia litoralis TaxID=2211119 RepID=A0A328C2Z6_9DELT|nr:YiaA/YiaB family inner membrane protein [Lujinxingia litoralis]RAL20862.1 hypothetical protein DL240_14345 [Lujinxingia litoralis]
MEHPTVQKDTNAWIFQVWASFLLATGITITGIVYLPVDLWMKSFLLMGMLFTLGSSFTLSKTIRDNHEARRLINRVSDAKAEKILREYELRDVA